MKRVLLALGMASALLAAGCGSTGVPSSARTPECAPVQGGVGVCVNGKAIDSTGPKPFHAHETGGFYASVDDLAHALNVTPQITADKKAVTVGNKAVQSMVQGAKNIHDHDGKVYAPIKEFAEAAGFHVDVNTEKATVSIYK